MTAYALNEQGIKNKKNTLHYPQLIGSKYPYTQAASGPLAIRRWQQQRSSGGSHRWVSCGPTGVTLSKQTRRSSNSGKRYPTRKPPL